MDRFKSILVAASPGHLEPLTLRAAMKLADANDARVEVIDVVRPLPSWRRTINVEGRAIDIEAALLRDREERLRRMIENIGTRADTTVIEMTGEPFIEVIRRVLIEGHDLVMVGEPAAERPNEPRLSSGVMHLLRKCPVPVYVMRPTPAGEDGILALVDPNPDDPVHKGLNDLILELATSLARREGTELHVGHAWNLEGEATLRSSAYMGLPGEVLDVMLRDTEDLRREHLEALTSRHIDRSECSIHLVAGAPSVALPQLAEDLGVGLIVMGTVGRTGLSGLIMGNTAETILRSVRCSVLAVKPEGFVTPVRVPHRSLRSSQNPSRAPGTQARARKRQGTEFA
jgi:nucleotide-binding universal stress UspA family protein